MGSKIPTNHDVVAVSWDVSRGIITGLPGKLLLYIIARRFSIPFGLYHVGILVFDRQFEFGDWGIDSKSIATECPRELTPIYRAGGVLKTFKLGITDKTLKEFEQWQKSVSEATFGSKHYCMSTNNCAHWARAACEFLNVEPLKDWNNLCCLTEKNYLLIKGVNRVEAASQRLSERQLKLLAVVSFLVIICVCFVIYKVITNAN